MPQQSPARRRRLRRRREPPRADGAGENPPARPFVVGDKVVTSSGTHKDKHDNKKAEVVKALSRPVVKFLEGKAIGQTKDFDKSKLTLLTDAPETKHTQCPPGVPWGGP